MARLASTDRDWERWGKENPYFGVISHPKYLNANLNDNGLKEFFDSGESHVDHVYRVIHERVKPNFHAVRVLDYGCGAGRLVVPFSKRSQSVVGIDVSPSMVGLARQNCDKFGAVSARLLHVDEMTSLAPASFDLVHSFIVLQHIPPNRGELILRKLTELIVVGGVGAIHFTYCDSRPSTRARSIKVLRQRVHLVNGLINLVRRRPFLSPNMEMHNYSMNRIFGILIDAHCSNLHVEFTNHAGFRGAMLYFEKSPRHLF
jgi:SAM-dependent methyltransferase